MVRFSTKIRQLNEGGLINYWRKKEMAKVARMSTDGSDQKHTIFLYKNFIFSSLYNKRCGKSDPL